jgi:hypothetical protein
MEEDAKELIRRAARTLPLYREAFLDEQRAPMRRTGRMSP